MYLYFVVSDNGLFKIGKSDNTAARAACIKSNSPCDVSMFLWIRYDDAEIDLEDILHETFAYHRVRGEWFALDYRDWDWVLSTIKSELDDQVPAKAQAYLRATLKEMRDWGFFQLGRDIQMYKTQGAALNRLSAFAENLNVGSIQ